MPGSQIQTCLQSDPSIAAGFDGDYLNWSRFIFTVGLQWHDSINNGGNVGVQWHDAVNFVPNVGLHWYNLINNGATVGLHWHDVVNNDVVVGVHCYNLINNGVAVGLQWWSEIGNYIRIPIKYWYLMGRVLLGYWASRRFWYWILQRPIQLAKIDTEIPGWTKKYFTRGLWNLLE